MPGPSRSYSSEMPAEHAALPPRRLTPSVQRSAHHTSDPRSFHLLLSCPLAVFLAVLLCDPLPSYDQSLTPASQLFTAAARAETRAAPAKDTKQASEYRPAHDIKRFTAPTIRMRGTAEGIGLDSRSLATVLATQFLEEFAFLQPDFAFEKTYETWEIGLFECEVWTVGSIYPIAFHVQCAAGSMDAPRHWQYANLGYGPKDKIPEAVRSVLHSIVTEYATFVRAAHDNAES